MPAALTAPSASAAAVVGPFHHSIPSSVVLDSKEREQPKDREQPLPLLPALVAWLAAVPAWRWLHCCRPHCCWPRKPAALLLLAPVLAVVVALAWLALEEATRALALAQAEVLLRPL